MCETKDCKNKGHHYIKKKWVCDKHYWNLKKDNPKPKPIPLHFLGKMPKKKWKWKKK